MAHLRIKEIATKKRYNKAQLANASGVNRNTTAQYWNEEKPKRMISLVVLERYAKVLEVKVTDLIEDDEVAH